MDKHWDAYGELSLVHFLAFPECMQGSGPILESISKIAEDDFFSGIEISRINNAALRREAASLIEQSHLKVDYGVHPMILGEKLNLNALDSGERLKAISAVESYIPQATELGARRYVLLSGPDPGPAFRAEAHKLLIDSLLRLCESARRSGLSVILETFDREVDKKAFIGPVKEAANLSAAIKKDFPDFGLLYDMAHMLLLDETPRPALQELKNSLAHAHLGNCVKVPGRRCYGDLHPRFGFPGGENDTPQVVEFLDALFEIGYLGGKSLKGGAPGVGFEVRPQSGESSNAILANIKRTWRAAWPAVRHESTMTARS